ncbi:MAG: hypothetical protein NTZ53_15300 [Cyanobacteria bacterium]|nr:hypothetical protein [Cyanobacteriota bacterium]
MASHFSTALNWLLCSEQNSLIHKISINDAISFCQTLDLTDAGPKTSLTLEIHHQGEKQTEMGLFGGPEILKLKGIKYPLFAREWENFTSNAAYKAFFEPNLIAEFDRGANGYEFMGLFQLYLLEQSRTDIAMESILFYAKCRQKDLQGDTIANSMDEALNRLQATINDIGPPRYIGYLDRGLCAVKLITNVTEDNLSRVIDFCEANYREIISRQLKELQSLEQMLKDLVATHKLIRMSVDFDLATAQFQDRLSFECVPIHKISNQLASSKSLEDKSKNNFSYASHFANYYNSLEIERSLPYSKKRPSINLVNEESLYVCYTHRKLSISNRFTEIKDYVLVSLDSDRE